MRSALCHTSPGWLIRAVPLSDLVASDDTKQIRVAFHVLQQYEPREIIARLAALICSGKVEFPYKKYLYTNAQLLDNIQKFASVELVYDVEPFKPVNVCCRTVFIDFTYRGPRPTVQVRKIASTEVTVDDAERKVVDLDSDDLFFTIGTSGSWYSTFHVIADVFTEPVRMRARRYNVPQCPLDYWRSIEGSSRVLNLCWNKYHDFSAYHVRESMYPTVRECETFKTTLAYLLYTRVFQAKSVLDICAGWGDRLVAAIAAGIEYTGVDANSSLTLHYQNILTAFTAGDEKAQELKRRRRRCRRPKRRCKRRRFNRRHRRSAASTDRQEKEKTFLPARDKYNMITSDFLECTLPPTASYDLIFSCPPFFKSEFYSADSTQSVVRFPELQQWTKHFLCGSLKKAWQFLQNDGHMAIMLNDYGADADGNGGYHYCEAMVLYCQACLDHCDFRGVIAYATLSNSADAAGRLSRIRQPIWVFAKTLQHNQARSEQARQLLQQHYAYILE